MKTTKINLLLYKEDYIKIEDFFKKFRWAVFIYSFILVVALFIFFISSKRLDNRINEIQTQKSSLLTQIKSQSSQEANFIYLSKKIDIADQFLKQDVKFLPYYNLLATEFNKIGSDSATLESFSVGNDRKTIFKATFKDLSSMLGTLKFIESDSFLDKFDVLTLTSANALEATSANSLYEISFEGKFKELK